jgi:hypothetical protein
MDKEIITAENGLYSYSNTTYSSRQRITWVYITSFRTATEAAVCNIHTYTKSFKMPTLLIFNSTLFFITHYLCHPLHSVSIVLSISM